MIPGLDKNELLADLTESMRQNARRGLIIGSHSNLNHISSVASGSLKINPSRKFHLILDKPDSLVAFDRHEIKCCLCGKMITYPAWHYNVKYAVNHFHYFICFDSASPSKPSCKCYRRNV